ncbi:hypothetical protein C8Q80DRAFT_1267045 [Daedaleopsis nitida]|nr:hypothetical protein C8Q80DRAFT_1267045 [Daedaleopsis nitida]
MTSTPPDLTALISAIKESFACLTLGVIIATSIYGITVLQTYIYFRRYLKDSLGLKAVVGTLFVLDTATTGLMAAALYHYVVTNFDGPLETFISVTPSDMGYMYDFMFRDHSIIVLTASQIIIGFIAQCFFVQRLWYLSRNKLVVGFLLFLAIASLGTGLVIMGYLLTHTQVLALDSPVIRIPTGFAGIMSAICDIAIVIALCYYLQSGRSGFAKTDSLVDRLMMYAIQRGSLTAICQTFYVIFALVYHARLIFLPFSLVLGKLYCNTVLATLNVRQSLKEFNHSGEAMEPGSQVLRNARTQPKDLSTLEINITTSQQQTSSFTLDHRGSESKTPGFGPKNSLDNV